MIKDPKKAKYFQKIGYNPIEKAVQVHNSDAQIRVIIAGQRAGKTTICVKEAGYALLKPRTNIWVVGVDYEKTHRFIFGAGKSVGVMEDLLKFHPGIIDRKSHSRHYLSLKNGSVIKGKSILKEETFIAEAVDMIICEDAFNFPVDFYDKYIRPRIIDTGGKIIINSIPPFSLGTENFISYLISQVKKSQGRIELFNWSAEDNSYLNKEEILKLRFDLPPNLQKIIIDGQLPTEEISLFGKVREQLTNHTGYIQGHLYQAGVDIGFTHNRTVVAVSDITTGHLDYIEILPQGLSEADVIFNKILSVLEKYNFPLTYWDMSGAGNVFYHYCSKYPFIKPYYIRNRNERNALINGLISAFAKGFKIIPNETLINELENLTIIHKTGYYLYKPKAGYNDDCIMATAMSLLNFYDKINSVSSTLTINKFNYFLISEKEEDEIEEKFVDYVEI